MTAAARLMLDLRAVRARAYVRIVGSIREPSWVISDSVFPAFAMAAFVLFYRALGAPREYETVAVIGGVLSTYWINVLWGMGAQLYWEKQQGQLALYFAAPCSRMSILAGMALGSILIVTVRAVFAIGVGFLILRVPVHAFDFGALASVFGVTMVALYSMGMLFSSLFLLYGREAWHVCNALIEPVYFLSGMYFPLRTLGGLGAFAAGIIPLGLGTDAMRQVIIGPAAHGLLPVRTEIALLAVLGTLLFLAARIALDYLERLSKREGRLTQRWQ